jgi:prepilin-type N-terminal cleavage/methylation domain-containing protein
MKNNQDLRKAGFTLIEVMIVIVVLGILFAILMPQLARSKEHAQVVICMNNLRQVALGYRNYMHDYDGAMPEREYWLDDFSPIYMYTRKKDEVFTCPNTTKPPWYVWDEDGNLRNGDFLTGGTIEDVEKNHNLNNGHGNNPYHFDPGNPSPNTVAMMAAKRSDRVVYEKYWGLHFNGEFFNVVHINDLHYEKERNGMTAYWTLDDRGWIETSLDPYPVDGSGFQLGDVGAGGWSDEGGSGGDNDPFVGDCTFCGGDGVKDNGQPCNKCGGDGVL